MGFLMKCPTILGPDGGAPWVYPKRSNPQPGQGAGLCASGYRLSERVKELNRCEIKGGGLNQNEMDILCEEEQHERILQ